MKLSAVVTRDDLAKVASDFTPLRIGFGARGGGSVTLGKPHAVELLAGRGVRLVGDAKLVWAVAGLPLPVTVRSWTLLLVPKLGSRGGMLAVALDPVLLDLDFNGIPAFVADRIALALNDALAAQRRRLAWAYGKTLSVRLGLPQRIAPAGRFELFPTSGEIEVTESEVRFTVTFDSRVVRVADEARRSA